MFYLKDIKYKDILNIKELYIPENKVTSIVGKSGSGKTTLLRLLNKLISQSEGEILFKETPLKETNSIYLRRNVIMLSQIPVIFSGTIKDNLLIGLEFSEKSLVNDKKLMDTLKMVHLNKNLKDDANTLSGGEKQRLALGRIILMEPEVFLLDEPSSSLDEGSEKIIIEAIVNYTRKTNKTLVMVTHSKSIAQAFSDIIVEVKNGQIVDRKEV